MKNKHNILTSPWLGMTMPKEMHFRWTHNDMIELTINYTLTRNLSLSLSVQVTYNITDPIIKTTKILHVGSKF